LVDRVDRNTTVHVDRNGNTITTTTTTLTL
jgi:hypothetical protein